MDAACVLLRGNAYARIVTGWDGQVRQLIPLSPDRVQVLDVAGKLAYDYTTKDGKVTRLLAGEVLHLRHRAGDDGVMGVSPITAAREVVQLAMAERDHGNASFSNAARLSGVLTAPGVLKPEQREALKTSWASQYSGVSNAGNVS